MKWFSFKLNSSDSDQYMYMSVFEYQAVKNEQTFSCLCIVKLYD